LQPRLLFTFSVAGQFALAQNLPITAPADAKELQEAVKFEAQGHTLERKTATTVDSF
jgi:hypothetical protein